MKRLLALLTALFCFFSTFAKAEDAPVFELRTYQAADGKLDELVARFKNHTLGFFEKYGFSNVFYGIPAENPDHLLIYLISSPSLEAHKTNWAAFQADPEWLAAKASTEVNGKLVEKVDSLFLAPTDYSPALKIESVSPPRQLELRTYTTNEGKLDGLDARFRDHTIRLFEKYGITNVAYFHPLADQPGASTTLVYFLLHADDAARQASFKAFGQDPEWQSARKASEEAGPLLIKGGVKSVPMTTTDYSPLR
jgi:hypothetical protein